jgi:translation initiation factor 2 beta subunit (eIF-2beta)/eIF-5
MIANNKLYLCSDESLIDGKQYDYIVDLPEYKTATKDDIMLTYFVNIIDFSNSIEVDKILLLNIIKYELSCSIYFASDAKLYYFTGIYEESAVNNIICKFIRNYVLCKVCDKPFVKFRLRHKRLKQKCFECGTKKYVDKSLEKTNVYDLIKCML